MSTRLHAIGIIVAIVVCVALLIRKIRLLIPPTRKYFAQQDTISESLANSTALTLMPGKLAPSQILANYVYGSTVLYVFGIGLFFVLAQYSHKDAPVVVYAIPVLLAGSLVAVIGSLYAIAKRKSLNFRGRRHMVLCFLLVMVIFFLYFILAMFV